MTQQLVDLIEAARDYKMSPEEQDAQACSFAYGNTHLENEQITREMVAKEFSRLRARIV